MKFAARYADYEITDEYSVEIVIPDEYPNAVPKALEIDNRIPKDFHHYLDGSLCLGAPLAVKHTFSKNPTLAGFVVNCFIPYLYSFSYKCRFGKMPFGELSHNGYGILEYYRELFGLENHRPILQLLKIIIDDKYRGHTRCPCGSGKRLRACHGKTLLEIKTLQSKSEFQGDYQYIVRSLVERMNQHTYRSNIN